MKKVWLARVACKLFGHKYKEENVFKEEQLRIDNYTCARCGHSFGCTSIEWPVITVKEVDGK